MRSARSVLPKNEHATTLMNHKIHKRIKIGAHGAA